MTNDLDRRMYEHKNHLVKDSHSAKYYLEYCVYYEEFLYPSSAIAREKQIKGWTREKKIALINSKNPEWKTLVSVPDSTPKTTWQSEYEEFLKEVGMEHILRK